jgi:large subunit ribosomal protein L35
MAKGHAWPAILALAETSAGPLIEATETEMPKMKSKSGAKKRFSVTGTGKIRHNQANKQHGMSKRPNDMLRNSRGTALLSAPDAKIVRKFLPYL